MWQKKQIRVLFGGFPWVLQWRYLRQAKRRKQSVQLLASWNLEGSSTVELWVWMVHSIPFYYNYFTKWRFPTIWLGETFICLSFRISSSKTLPCFQCWFDFFYRISKFLFICFNYSSFTFVIWKLVRSLTLDTLVVLC